MSFFLFEKIQLNNKSVLSLTNYTFLLDDHNRQHDIRADRSPDIKSNTLPLPLGWPPPHHPQTPLHPTL